MQKSKVYSIITDRFARWSRKLADNHATPLIAIGVGHDHNSGQVHICTLENDEMSNDVIAAFLKHAVDLLEGKTPDNPSPSVKQTQKQTVVGSIKLARQQITENEVLCLLSAAISALANSGQTDNDQDRQNLAELRSAANKLRATVDMDQATFDMMESHSAGKVSTSAMLTFINAGAKQRGTLH